MPKKINILIIDDHPMIVESYIRVLESFNSIKSELELQIEFSHSISSSIEKIENTNKENVFDVILLDISLPRCPEYKLNSGEELGLYIKKKIPSVKLIVITMFDDNLRLLNIFATLKPESFIIKTEINGNTLFLALNNVLEGNSYYSKSINELILKRAPQTIVLDKIYTILIELSNGSKMKELKEIIPLTKSGIEKRKRLLKKMFQAESDRDLVISAREKGFI